MYDLVFSYISENSRNATKKRIKEKLYQAQYTDPGIATFIRSLIQHRVIIANDDYISKYHLVYKNDYIDESSEQESSHESHNGSEIYLPPQRFKPQNIRTPVTRSRLKRTSQRAKPIPKALPAPQAKEIVRQRVVYWPHPDRNASSLKLIIFDPETGKYEFDDALWHKPILQ